MLLAELNWKWFQKATRTPALESVHNNIERATVSIWTLSQCGDIDSPGKQGNFLHLNLLHFRRKGKIVQIRKPDGVGECIFFQVGEAAATVDSLHVLRNR